jgi:1-acyl-sn-glycerol-3-phosphate acyltransferase
VLALLFVNPLSRSIRIGEFGLDETMLSWWAGLFCSTFGVAVKIRGDIEPGPVLVVANHISWLDIVALHSAVAMGFVSKAEVARWPLIGMMARASGTVFHERGNQDSSSSVADAMIGRLKKGHRIAIFPEGGIKPGDSVKIFHARLFRVAVEAQCPVQPVMLRYMRNGHRDPDITFIRNEGFLMNFMRLLGRPSCVCELQFLEPIEAQGSPRRELSNAAQYVIEQAFEGISPKIKSKDDQLNE